MNKLIVVVALALLLLLAGDALACPNCREAVANEASDAGRQASGYAWSILFMIAMPFTLLGAGTMMLVRAVRSGAMPEM